MAAQILACLLTGVMCMMQWRRMLHPADQGCKHWALEALIQQSCRHKVQANNNKRHTTEYKAVAKCQMPSKQQLECTWGCLSGEDVPCALKLKQFGHIQLDLFHQ